MKPLSQHQIETYKKSVAIIREYIFKAQYKSAYKLALESYRNDPRNPLKKMRYAILLGDHQEGLSETQIQANKKKAAKILGRIVDKYLSIIPDEYKTSLLNEYFWFSEQPEKQYQLGVKNVKRGEYNGYYSQGVGASMMAIHLCSKGQMKMAKKWGQHSINAWKSYFKFRPDYYNAYSFLALAYGAIGDFKAMESSLLKASKLSGRASTYSEFCNIRLQVWRAHLEKAKLNEAK